MTTDTRFTQDDLDRCWPYAQEYFLQVLNGEYPLDEAVADLGGLVGSEFDPRVKTENEQHDAE